MAEFVRVAGVSDVPMGSGRVFEVGDRSIAIFNVDGSFFATDNTCAHRGGPLGEGELEGEVVTCPWHSWEYNVRTGISLTTPSASVKTYDVQVDGEDVKVRL
ncbi:Nitrite reductase (NAD(P)H) small subunit [Nitrospira tepida]|uniref:Nitrite reductase (NAD(P)H) small subunit n=1 Tax=Nitrospira tepida TaxID=2973512 RepID=A0AA86T0U0_9BACT|nr:Rieske (2Fe-2S) protein [Nitrospira tepida]CAI4029839.1 Nitrite reductase (NAD(P)H) small subunit [Nitrospira tepida]